MASSCSCCGFAGGKKFGNFNACSMCQPKSPEERIYEGVLRDELGRARKAMIRQVTYKCSSPLCSRQEVLHRSHFPEKWLED